MATTHRTRVAEPTSVSVPLRALRAVAAVSAEGSVARAAEALHQSSAAVTRAVQAAEQALGVALFERGARGMVPTAAGEGSRCAHQAHCRHWKLGPGFAHTRRALSVPRAKRLREPACCSMIARGMHPTEAAAARAVGLSQPALNQALRRLEHAAKTNLYERTRLGTRLNESGEWLLQQVKVALAEIRVGHEELARWRGQVALHVAIGSLPMARRVSFRLESHGRWCTAGISHHRERGTTIAAPAGAPTLDYGRPAAVDASPPI